MRQKESLMRFFDESLWKVGAVVRHSTLGEGVILRIYSDDGEVEVGFKNAGVFFINPTCCPLQIRSMESWIPLAGKPPTVAEIIESIDSSGYGTVGVCSRCGAEGVLMRQLYSNKVWHYHLVCEKCSRTVSGSIARAKLNGIDLDNLPIYEYSPSPQLPVSNAIFKQSYTDYLHGDWWKSVAFAVKWLAGFRCQVCGSALNLQAHHNSYARKGAERPEDLVCLCDECHRRHHNK